MPLIACAPVQPPDAVHDVAFVLDQVSVELLPVVIDVGLALRVTVGSAEVTVTVALAGVAVVPPGPVHASAYVVVAVGETKSVPLIACAPVQPPEAVQVVALVLDQLSVELLPAVIDAGLALSATVGSGDVTVTVAEAGVTVVPPGPVHASE